MFKTINYLMFEKNKKELDAELLASFSPMITTKAFSFYNKGMYCNYINDTLNTYFNVFSTVEDRFRFFDNVIPKLKPRRYEYISKPKTDDIPVVRTIPEFYSKREYELFENYGKRRD